MNDRIQQCSYDEQCSDDEQLEQGLKGVQRRAGVERRLAMELGAMASRCRPWTLSRLCDAVELVVDLQHLALVDGVAYEAMTAPREVALRVWVYELLLAAAAMGFDSVAPTLLDALPGVDMSGYQGLLAEVGVEAFDVTKTPETRAFGGVR